jgi:hypothetical protein
VGQVRAAVRPPRRRDRDLLLAHRGIGQVIQAAGDITRLPDAFLAARAGRLPVVTVTADDLLEVLDDPGYGVARRPPA